MSIRQNIRMALLAMARNRQRFVTALQVLTVAALVALTLVDVERDLGDGELWLSRAVPVVMAVGAVACVAARRGVRLAAIDVVVMVWWAAEFFLCYGGHGVFAPRAFWAFSEAVFLYFALRLLLSAGRLPGLWVAALVVAGCLCESALGIHQLLTDTGRHGLFPVTGTFLNPGPYSAYLAVGVSIVLAGWRWGTEAQELSSCSSSDNSAGGGIRVEKDVDSASGGRNGEPGVASSSSAYGRRTSSAWLLPFYLLTFLLLSVAWSRAAWVAVAVVAACVYWRRLARYKYVVLAVVVAGGAAAYLLKQGSADGRVVMWLGSIEAIAADPWTGAGIGGFGGAYAGGLASLFADGGAQWLLPSANVTDNAYNELLTIGVEQGLPGMAAMAAVTVMALLRLRRSCRPLMYGLLALVVFSMFSYPLHCQPYRILFVIMCAWAAPAPSDFPMRGRTRCGIAASPHGRGAFYLFAFLLFLASLVVRADMERRVAASEDYRLMAGVDATYLIDDYYELLPLMDDNERFLFDFGKALADLGRHNDSNAMLRRGAELSADPMFLVVMGNNFRAMGLPAEAERCYRRAFSVMPNRIYPLYRLMKLYDEQGRRADCLRMARRVATFDVKVESEATREMKREAEGIVSAGELQRNFSSGNPAKIWRETK